MELGAAGVIKPSAQSVYAIFGSRADLIKNEIIKIQSEIEINPSLEEKLFLEIDSLNESQPVNDAFVENSDETIIVYSPISGKLVDLKDIPDETFSEKMIGDGVGIITTGSDVVSPIDGKVELVFPGGHAYVINSIGGTSIMVHLGIDSVGLKDNGDSVEIFKPHVKGGKKVKHGDKIVNVDVKLLKSLAKSNISPVLVLNETIKGRKVELLAKKGNIKAGDPIFQIVPNK
jgi:PTS system glucose-specific IIC component